MLKDSLVNKAVERMRSWVQHFDPEKYFRMRDKVVCSGGGVNCTECFSYTG